MKKKQDEYTEEKYRIKWLKSAKKDLHEIVLFIAENNPQTALKINQKIKDRADSLDHFPFRGSYVPELLERNLKEYRQLSEPPWRIIYKVIDKTVNILAVIDTRRNLQDLLLQRFLYPNY